MIQPPRIGPTVPPISIVRFTIARRIRAKQGWQRRKQPHVIDGSDTWLRAMFSGNRERRVGFHIIIFSRHE
jgi:hypothetical protein